MAAIPYDHYADATNATPAVVFCIRFDGAACDGTTYTYGAASNVRVETVVPGLQQELWLQDARRWLTRRNWGFLPTGVGHSKGGIHRPKTHRRLPTSPSRAQKRRMYCHQLRRSKLG